jgi:hypothetical protein
MCALIAIHSEREADADLFLTSLDNYHKRCRSKEKKAVDAWRMTALQKGGIHKRQKDPSYPNRVQRHQPVGC